MRNDKTADRMLILLEVDGELKQVPLTESRRMLIKQLLLSMFDGCIKVVDQDLPIKILDEETDET